GQAAAAGAAATPATPAAPAAPAATAAAATAAALDLGHGVTRLLHVREVRAVGVRGPQRPVGAAVGDPVRGLRVARRVEGAGVGHVGVPVRVDLPQAAVDAAVGVDEAGPG